ncbi:MAG: 4Fe-4S dicluster domain-containing protein [Desulfitobacteriaceae bacterium]|nr:4Fe-4S dicluster domain-containing protein [Desulfitobacteriaceae bacterium]MDI6914294.1 4Fe-4S dicluster domain-containing protein [Desulfitobacteriaceae bacterium]
MMKQLIAQMQEIARELLETGIVQTVIGWEKGSRWYLSPPVFVRKPEDAGRLWYDQFAVPNLSGYLLDYRNKNEKVAVFVKGCDSRSVVRLIQDNQVRKENIVAIGVPCAGMRDQSAVNDEKEPHELPLLSKCLQCRYPNPVYADRTVGEAVVDKSLNVPDDLDAGTGLMGGDLTGDGSYVSSGIVERLEGLSSDDRYDFWQKAFSKCLRCYACRNVCPACSCRECIMDSEHSLWVGKGSSPTENMFNALIRAYHVAGRCTTCGECERVCPVGIPLMALNQFLGQEVNKLLEAYDAGIDETLKPPLEMYGWPDFDGLFRCAKGVRA